MLTIDPCVAKGTLAVPSFSPPPSAEGKTMVALVDGNLVDLAELSSAELVELQCTQEPAFAQLITASKKGSPERTAIVRQAYESICTILDEIEHRKSNDESLSMGMDGRYKQLVVQQLAAQSSAGIEGGVFELGFGTGILLKAVSDAGYRIGGLEVASQLFREAKLKLPDSSHENLWLGDFCSTNFGEQFGSYSVAYWNDVFEHIPVDEISDYLDTLHSLLKRGGKLITITPNWHMRPSDVTDLFSPPRSSAVGFHLKEYTLREVRQLLFAAGFTKIQTPLFISRHAIHMSDALDITALKSSLEPLLEWLPFRAAVQACRRLGLSCTVATKGK